MTQSHGRPEATTESTTGHSGNGHGSVAGGVRPDMANEQFPYDAPSDPSHVPPDDASRRRLPHDRRRPDAVITEAEPSQSDQLRSRQRRYATMMGIRVVCLIGAVLTFHIFWPIAVVFIVGMVALPWCAVLIANDRPPIKPSMFQRYRGHPDPGHAIEARSHRVIDE